MNRLIQIINDLPIEDLRLLKKDVECGNMERLINKKITSNENRGSNICPVCHEKVDADTDKVLIFGPQGLRKKAVFCAYDCMGYFLKKLRNQDEFIRRSENGTY
jgi:hypothetical protein